MSSARNGRRADGSRRLSGGRAPAQYASGPSSLVTFGSSWRSACRYRVGSDGARGTAEAGCRCRLHHAFDLHKALAGHVVRMVRSFRQVEYRRIADIGARHDLVPLVAGLGFDHIGQASPLVGPPFAIVAVHRRSVGQTGFLEQLVMELALDRTDRDELAVRGLVHAVVVGAAVEEVGFPLVGPAARAVDAVDGGHQRSGTLGHGSVHDLSLPGVTRLEQRGAHAEGQVHAAASEVAHQVERRARCLSRSDGMQCAGQGDVVDVVAGGV